MAESDADTIHLSLPADSDLRPVVEVAVSLLARRWGLADDEITAARAAAADAFVELAGADADDPVDIEVHATPQHLTLRLTHAATERTIEAPGS